jgi:CubicO group peptidase (beta-lactamase class C family)
VIAEGFEAPRDVLRRAIRHLACPGAVVEVGDVTQTLWTEPFGHLSFGAGAPAVRVDTIFDLASLTKILSTAPLLMRAIEQGALGLGDRVADHVAEWRGPDRESVTLRDLLSHSAGLPAHRHYYRELTGIDDFRRAITSEPLEYAPGTRSVYSDLGFMLIGFILGRERTLADRFDALRSEIAPADDLQFHPPPGWVARTAPTEIDWWRGRLLRAEVHDENTFALGGAAGHAGLFGTAAAVGSMARHVLQVLGGRTGAFRAETMREFITRRPGVPGSRALAWDTMMPTSSCGTLMSPISFGHTGFTGTSLWIDPERGLYVVLLTNRVHPTRANTAIQNVRRALHDAVMSSLPRRM